MKQSSLKGVKYGCTEYAVERLTGRNLLKETGLKPEQIGFDDVERLANFKISPGHPDEIRSGKLDKAILRIVPQGQMEEHSIILIKGGPRKSTIEDQFSRRIVSTSNLASEWRDAGMKYARSKDDSPKIR
jgi:hypothetical protein